jgi:hypothetical protein
MITLEEYKEYLINYYRYEIDNNDLKREERRKEFITKYSNEYIQKIIDDTYQFIREIFESDTIDYGYYNHHLEDDTTSYISLNICGGGFADTIFKDTNDRCISKYILRKVFGSHFMVYIKDDEIEYETEDPEIMGINCNYSLYMQEFPTNMKEIKENIFGSAYVLK